MFSIFKALLIVGFSLFNYPSYGKEMSVRHESLSSSVEEIAEEMINLNSSLSSLSNTVSKLLLGDDSDSGL
tara:strand:+ start:200 stop:412 length:213 start_codon:yes stop_codon:yes gene_type:complete